MFDSSTGFRLPDGSVLSPDAALVGFQRWEPLNAHERRSFPPLCPDLVVELANGAPQRIEQAEVLDSGSEFPGLRLELAEIWDASTPTEDFGGLQCDDALPMLVRWLAQPVGVAELPCR